MTNDLNNLDYKKLCQRLLHAESEEKVTKILDGFGLLDPVHWKLLGDMPNNRSMVNNLQPDPAGALVEKLMNSVDAMLTRECYRKGIHPESTDAPPTMVAAAEMFFGIPDGNLYNLGPKELRELAENIQLIATGSKSEPSYLVVDQGEGQTPDRFKDTFLSLVRANKDNIPFVQGKFNCGGTGVMPFCGKEHCYQLIISRRCPDIPSQPAFPEQKDPSHDKWGFTVIRKLPPSAGVYNTMVYVYLAPGGQVPRFEAESLVVLPESEETDVDGKMRKIPTAYKGELGFGTVVKLFNYQWKARSLATTDARFELERYLYRLSLPIRVVETRRYKAHYYATTVAGTSDTIVRDKDKDLLDLARDGELQPDGIGTLPISIVLYKPGAKDPRRLPKGLYFTINGQVHFSMDQQFFTTRGLNYGFLRKTMLVTVDCTNLQEDIRDHLVMPSRDRLRKVPAFDIMINSIVDDLKDCDALREINYKRRLQKTKEALTQDAVQDVFQSLLKKNRVLASLLDPGKILKDPYDPGEDEETPYEGKKPPTYFRFKNGSHRIEKTFPIDRTCAVEVETDAINDYFHLPNPTDRGKIEIEPKCYERWNLWDGRLRITCRAPSNARIGDKLSVKIKITDPCLEAGGHAPWVNTVDLGFTEGGAKTKSGTKSRTRHRTGSLGFPEIVPVHKDGWAEHEFTERSGLAINSGGKGNGYVFFVNMDNLYLKNELMSRQEDSDKEAAKFAYQWGMVLIALGMLQELKKKEAEIQDEADDEEVASLSPEDHVSEFSAGVAAVIVPTILNLMDALETTKA